MVYHLVSWFHWSMMIITYTYFCLYPNTSVHMELLQHVSNSGNQSHLLKSFLTPSSIAPMRGFAGLDWLINTKQRCSKCGDSKGMPTILNIISAIMYYSHIWIKWYRQGVHVTETCCFHATWLRTLFFVAPKLHKFQTLWELHPRSITAQQHPPSNLSSVTVCHVESWPKWEGRSTPLQAAVLTLAIFLGLTASEDEMWNFPLLFRSINCEIVRTNSTPSPIMTWNWQMNIIHSTSTITCI